MWICIEISGCVVCDSIDNILWSSCVASRKFSFSLVSSRTKLTLTLLKSLLLLNLKQINSLKFA